MFKRICLFLFISTFTVPASASLIFSEDFDDITNLPGWTLQNNSDPLGTTNWFQGNPMVFPAHTGADNAYIAANFNNTGSVGTISNWLLTPELSLLNGNVFSFFTSSASNEFPDRLELRLSTSGGSSNVGSSATDVGDFSILLLSINADLLSGYPMDWSQFTATLSGLTGGETGRFAFRYFVTDAGGLAPNANYIGIDTVTYLSTPTSVPVPGTFALLGLGLAGFAAARRRK